MKKNKRKIHQTESYIKRSKREIGIIIIFFLLAAILGFANADYLKSLEEILKQLIDQTQDLSGMELLIFIFLNNILISFQTLIAGIFAGIIPIIITLINGIVIGFVLERTAQISIANWWRILPHGIFELAGVFIALGMGLRLGKDILKKYFSKKKDTLFKFLGILSIALGLIGILIFRVGFELLFAENNQIQFPLSQVSGLALFITGIIFIIPYLILFFGTDKELRRYNLQQLKSSLISFFRVVLPLIFIGAIIETLLITLL